MDKYRILGIESIPIMKNVKILHDAPITCFLNQSNQMGDWHHPATLPVINPVKRLPTIMSDDDEEHQKDVDVLIAEPEIAQPPMYAVIMYNDNYTPMEFVVYILESEFKHSIDKAVQIMLDIHHNGRGTAGIYPKDIAETKAKKVNMIARKEGYPLLTQIEPHQE